MVEKQVIIDVKEYEELKEWAEVGHSATEAVKKVLESGNPNKECRTITLYKNIGNGEGYTKICICTTDEILKDMEDCYNTSIKGLNEDSKYWQDRYWELQHEFEKKFKEKIEEYNNLPLWKRIFRKIKL